MKILIAEDDIASRIMIKAHLTKWGYDVTSAREGNEAFAALQQSDAPQLAILDWGMPDLDGVTLCQKLRKQKRKLPLYLILLTSRSDTGDIVQGLEAGADEYIVKPYHHAELQAKVKVGCRVLLLQNEIQKHSEQLESLNVSLQTRVQEIVGELRQKDQQLIQVQKLESIGQLAAGIAHEINSPLQYIQNNVTFIERGCKDLRELFFKIAKADKTTSTAALLESVNLPLLMEELPESIDETLEGINRISKIVKAMKDFSHPGSDEKIPADLNRALGSTLIVCHNEWKHLAEISTDFAADLPLVPCCIGQLNQVFLNLIINATQAIEAQHATSPEHAGLITITTRQDGDWVEILVRDNGCGIPEAIRQRIFDPFFTTKAVGKGTGQGLAIAHDIVVTKHGGQIGLASPPGQNTLFSVRLPLNRPPESRA